MAGLGEHVGPHQVRAQRAMRMRACMPLVLCVFRAPGGVCQLQHACCGTGGIDLNPSFVQLRTEKPRAPW